MTELKIHYWPATPNLRELKFYVNGKLELSFFSDWLQIDNIKRVLEKTLEEMQVKNDEK